MASKGVVTSAYLNEWNHLLVCDGVNYLLPCRFLDLYDHAMVAAHFPPGHSSCAEDESLWTGIWSRGGVIDPFLDKLEKHGGYYNCLTLIPDMISDWKTHLFDAAYPGYRGNGMMYDIRVFLEPAAAYIRGSIASVIDMRLLALQRNDLDDHRRYETVVAKQDEKKRQEEEDDNDDDDDDQLE